jgi:hypothetical protein
MIGHRRIWIVVIALALIVSVGAWFGMKGREMASPVPASPSEPSSSAPPPPSAPPPAEGAPSSTDALVPPPAGIALPLPDALSRVTKKPFGIFITPANSPVQPEYFRGYHTGTDFETLPNEQEIDVPVSAICDGTLVMKKWATGYGGVAVERCTVDGQPVTVIYGHVRRSSVSPNAGDAMKAGEAFAVLGKGFSTETDGERKHLHLGIHKGTSISILGYVQKKSDLNQWIDPMSVLQTK